MFGKYPWIRERPDFANDANLRGFGAVPQTPQNKIDSLLDL